MSSPGKQSPSPVKGRSKLTGKLLVSEPAKVPKDVPKRSVKTSDGPINIRVVENSGEKDYQKLTSYMLQSLVAAKAGTSSSQAGGQRGGAHKPGELSSLNLLASLTAASLVVQRKQKEEEERKRAKTDERALQTGGKHRPRGATDTSPLTSTPTVEKGGQSGQVGLKVSIPFPLTDDVKPSNGTDCREEGEKMTIASLLKTKPPEYNEDSPELSTSDTLTASESQSQGEDFMGGWESENEKQEWPVSDRQAAGEGEQISEGGTVSADVEGQASLQSLALNTNYSQAQTNSSVDAKRSSLGPRGCDTVDSQLIPMGDESDDGESLSELYQALDASPTYHLGSSHAPSPHQLDHSSKAFLGAQGGVLQGQPPMDLPTLSSSTIASVLASRGVTSDGSISTGLGDNPAYSYPLANPAMRPYSIPGPTVVPSFLPGQSTPGAGTDEEMELDLQQPLISHPSLVPPHGLGAFDAAVTPQCSLNLPSQLITSKDASVLHEAACGETASQFAQVSVGAPLTNGLSHTNLQQKDSVGSTANQAPISAPPEGSSEAIQSSHQPVGHILPPSVALVDPNIQVPSAGPKVALPPQDSELQPHLSGLQSTHDSPSPTGKKAPLQDILCRDFTLEIRPCTPRKRSSSEHSPAEMSASREDDSSEDVSSARKRLRLTGHEEGMEERGEGLESVSAQVSTSVDRLEASGQAPHRQELEKSAADTQINRLAATVPLDVSVADLIAMFQDPLAQGDASEGHTASSLLEAAAQMESIAPQRSVSQMLDNAKFSSIEDASTSAPPDLELPPSTGEETSVQLPMPPTVSDNTALPPCDQGLPEPVAIEEPICPQEEGLVPTPVGSANVEERGESMSVGESPEDKGESQELAGEGVDLSTEAPRSPPVLDCQQHEESTEVDEIQDMESAPDFRTASERSEPSEELGHSLDAKEELVCPTGDSDAHEQNSSTEVASQHAAKEEGSVAVRTLEEGAALAGQRHSEEGKERDDVVPVGTADEILQNGDKINKEPCGREEEEEEQEGNEE